MNHDFHEVLKLIGRPVTYYPKIAEALDKDIRCAAFLSNFHYWDGKQHDAEGWIYKSQVDIESETGLGRYAQETARKKLKELGILEEKLKGKPPVLHYRFNWQRMNEVVNKFFVGDKAEKETQEDPLLYRMKLAFDECYEKHTEGIAFEWGNKKNSGKHWKALKDLAEYFKNRLIDRKKKANEAQDVHDDEIIHSFVHFLGMLPDYHVRINLTPLLLYSNVSKIVSEIVQKQRNGNSANQTPAPTPNEYV